MNKRFITAVAFVGLFQPMGCSCEEELVRVRTRRLMSLTLRRKNLRRHDRDRGR